MKKAPFDPWSTDPKVGYLEQALAAAVLVDIEGALPNLINGNYDAVNRLTSNRWESNPMNYQKISNVAGRKGDVLRGMSPLDFKNRISSAIKLLDVGSYTPLSLVDLQKEKLAYVKENSPEDYEDYKSYLFIKDNITAQAFKTWFEPIKAVKLTDDARYMGIVFF